MLNDCQYKKANLLMNEWMTAVNKIQANQIRGLIVSKGEDNRSCSSSRGNMFSWGLQVLIRIAVKHFNKN